MTIPRIIHRIWLGEDPLPEAFEAYGESWRTHHSDWEMRLWTDDDLPGLGGPDALQAARHAVQRSNLLRYELLRRFGGVYVDTDMECLRSIEPLLGGVEAFAGYEKPGKVCNAILGSVPGHPAFERAVREYARRCGNGRSRRPPDAANFTTELLVGFPGVTLFEPEKFYPFTWEDEPAPASTLDEAYTIHHWSRMGRGEPADLEGKVEFLREKWARARRRRARFQRRAAVSERKLEKMRRRAERAERRVADIERSLWWRLRPRALARAVRRLRR